MKMRGLDVGRVKFFDLDGQRISINEIPRIAVEFAIDILNKTGWPIQSKVFASPQCDSNKTVEADKMIHMSMRDENILLP